MTGRRLTAPSRIATAGVVGTDHSNVRWCTPSSAPLPLDRLAMGGYAYGCFADRG